MTVSLQSSSHEPIFSIASISPVEHDVGSTSQEAKSYDDGKYEENISNMGLVWRWKMLQTFFKLVMFSFFCVSCNCVSYNLMRLRFTTGKIKIRKVNWKTSQEVIFRLNLFPLRNRECICQMQWNQILSSEKRSFTKISRRTSLMTPTHFSYSLPNKEMPIYTLSFPLNLADGVV